MARELPAHTSASQLTSYAMCPRRYAMRYVLHLEPEFTSVALVLGSAVHGAIEWWFEERLAGRSPTLEGAKEIASADLVALTAGETVRWKKSTPVETEHAAHRLVALYLSAYGDLPVVAVEAPFEIDIVDPDTGEIFGRPLTGYFDLVLDDGSVVELKTSGRGWDEHALIRHLQAGAYAYALGRERGGASMLRIHVLVKLKREPRIEPFAIERTERDSRWWLRAAAAIEAAIAARNFPPAPGPLCRECEYERTCAVWVDSVDVHASPRRLPLAPQPGALHIHP